MKVAFQILQGENGAGGIDLGVQRRKCALTGGPREKVAPIAVELNVRHCLEGVTVCGMSIGIESYVASSLLGHASTVADHITKLMNLPLAK